MFTSAIHQPDEGERLSVMGEGIRLLADSKSTDGKSLVFEETSPVGHGPPLQRHGREDELYFVVEGRVKFVVDGRETVVSDRGAVAAPRGSVHTFVNVGEAPSRVLVVCYPGGLEEPFREIDQLTREGKVTVEAATAALKKCDVEVLGPPLKAASVH